MFFFEFPGYSNDIVTVVDHELNENEEERIKISESESKGEGESEVEWGGGWKIRR